MDVNTCAASLPSHQAQRRGLLHYALLPPASLGIMDRHTRMWSLALDSTSCTMLPRKPSMNWAKSKTSDRSGGRVVCSIHAVPVPSMYPAAPLIASKYVLQHTARRLPPADRDQIDSCVFLLSWQYYIESSEQSALCFVDAGPAEFRVLHPHSTLGRTGTWCSYDSDIGDADNCDST